MTAKKKRLLFMVLGVCLCALLALEYGQTRISIFQWKSGV